jgi:predicted DNA-binding transcriptional regulator AlpA
MASLGGNKRHPYNRPEASMTTDGSPYLLREPPTSPGRALLARAFEHWCGIHQGYSPEDIANAFSGSDEAERSVVQGVRFAARLLGELIAAGRLGASARPIGAGRPEPIPPGDWELDDFTSRFARSAFDPIRPFDLDAEPTHWIFVDLDDFNRIVEESCADVRPFAQAAKAIRRNAAFEEEPPAALTRADNLVRLPEVMRRTGMSRSTIYRRIEQRRFPTQISMDGNIAAWRESDLADWLANPR